MRDRDSWHRPVSQELGRLWNEVRARGTEAKPVLLCQVELALRLLERLAPEEPAKSAYVLLGGYPFARARGLVGDSGDGAVMLAAARHLLWPLRRGRAWHQALDTYEQLPDRLRGYRVESPHAPALAREPVVAADRFAVYDNALSALPPLAVAALPLAPSGRSTFVERRRPASVTIPTWLTTPPVDGHRPEAPRAGTGEPLEISRAELVDTARWMDATEHSNEVMNPGHWEARLAEVHLHPRDGSDKDFAVEGPLLLDGLLHLVGMVGAGKSTLMTLVAVWAARQDPVLRTTLVVGDVAEQLRLTALLRDLGLSAAPVLGLTTRETHVTRLHRRLASRGLTNLLDHDDPGFDDLSTVCVLDALRGTEAARPLRFADAPCTSLYPERAKAADVPDGAPLAPYRPGDPREEQGTPQLKGEPHGCPAWYACPRHRAARELVEAAIWVANPASLVQSAVPRHLGAERLRHLELACLRSDIVIVDEADSVQMNLDSQFAPSAALVSPTLESWLDQLQSHRIQELSRQGRLPLTDQDIERWATALSTAHTAADRVCTLLISHKDLREWADIEYFSPWTLQEKLLVGWFTPAAATGLPDGAADEAEVYEAYEEDLEGEANAPKGTSSPFEDKQREVLTAIFDAFRDDPLGGRGPYGDATDELTRLAQDVLHTLSGRDTRTRVLGCLRTLLADTPSVGMDEESLDITARRLEFLLALSVLHHRLDRLVFLWPHVEAALHLDSTGNELSRRPPLDYAPLVPEAPMGNVLGFQYLPDDRERDADGRCSGTLRFFRCAGVGRELLQALPDLGADPGRGRSGPQVLLMSGTSWAGTSTRAHITAPVGAVLKPSSRSLKAVSRTVFTTRFMYDAEGRPMSLSGTDPKVRPAAARALATRLGSPGRAGGASPLEQELAKVDDEGRRRALLLVGSYAEARTVADVLHGMDRWRGRVRVLAADDAELQYTSRANGSSDDKTATALRRGDLASFAEDLTAEVLVAPLMAVERGHNILNSRRNAAFGTALFLARPHPRPDDLSLAVFAINDWASRFVRNHPGLRFGTFADLVRAAPDLDAAALSFRHAARAEWRRLLSRRYIYSRLSDDEKRAFAWDQLVTVWQVIGRLVRGGVPARVVFVDARFAPHTARLLAPGSSTPAGPPLSDGLLSGLRDVLAPYFGDAPMPHTPLDPAEPAIVRLLYAPMYRALYDLTHHTP
ncbi:hypothetical protein [Streptomyces sp. MST-110588]|uniref:pPIWI_RE_Z domain-containing protein n=1 Tax=Streptomyces sp. MST-110588 TaxID=2833628 RepID=UPI001F5DC385|nr:hypothetical protein [Streptomyces sp. MST-110588]UNO39416.1 hypothetical protein KGS77_07105 [Streptomyces sp. MST-110588]